MSIKSIVSALKRSFILKWLLRGILFFTVWFVIHCALISLDGLADSDSAAEPADAAVVLGNEVMPNATAGEILRVRLQKALEVYQSGAARHIICSGGKGPGELWEADVMRDWLIARGVDRNVIVVDYDGKDSYSTAKSARKIFNANGWHSALIVSQFTHISRCKLAFRRFGISPVGSAHGHFQLSDLRGFTHEFGGYYYYLVRGYE